MNQIPRHVAIIMDGNGRWARQRHRPRHMGHQAGVKATRRVVELCSDRGIEALTIFAFSSENWRRPKSEVGLLMELFVTTLRREIGRLSKKDVRMRFIGERTAFAEKLQAEMHEAEERTRTNTGLCLNIAVNYGGRWDVTQAARTIAEKVQAGELQAADVDVERMASYMNLADLPEPDLFIRTGGERRISNFLLWQLAYTELYFTDCLWPDFDEAEFDAALQDFASRQRRFGRTGEQVEQGQEHV